MSCKIKLAATALILCALLASCGDTPAVDGSGSNTVTVTDEGTHIELGGSVTITEAGTYILTGSLTEGQITVDADKESKIEIVLDGVDITCSVGAPIYIKEADKVTLTLADGSVNTLKNTDGYTEVDGNNVDAVIFSKADLEIDGTGELSITAAEGNGITSKDDLVINNGAITVDVGNHALEAKDLLTINGGAFVLKSGKDAVHAENNDDSTLGNIELSGASFVAESTGDGIDASGYIRISGCSAVVTANEKGVVAAGALQISNSSFVIDSSDDALHSNADLLITDGTFELTTQDDGIHADNNARIEGGTITIKDSYEGIEGHTVDIVGGTVTLNASDDGINAAGGNDRSGFGGFRGGDMFANDADAYVTISGGTVTVNADGDGIDSNGALNVTGGELYISGPTNSANGTLDYAGDAVVSGGTVIAVGSVGMAQNFGSNSTQCAFMATISGAAGEELTISDASGSIIASYTPSKSYSCAIISHPSLKVGETYTVTAGNVKQSITLTSTITGGMGGMGGFGGGWFGGGGGNRGDRTQGGGKGGIVGGGQDSDAVVPEMPTDGTFPAMPDGGTFPEMPEGGFDFGGELPDGFDGTMPDGMTPPTGDVRQDREKMPNDGTDTDAAI